MNQPPIASAVAVPLAPPVAAELHQQGSFKLPSLAASAFMEENQIAQLIQQGFTRGLAKSLGRAKAFFALRIWIVDNSGSMQTTDGHRLVETRNRRDVKMVSCSRWEEIHETVNYHINLAGLIGAPTNFRLLNHPGMGVGDQQFAVAEAPGTGPHDVHEALSIMAKVRPGGCTPLTQHIYEINASISAMAPQLRQTGQRVAVIIATDGLPTDEMGYGGEAQKQAFVQSLRMLEGLPVWVVVRLCTDEENVVSFYNDLDALLELSIEVLDDFMGEAEEVYGHNPWLNYALPLHRLREMGYHDRVFDMLDERALTKSELRDFCAVLFGDEHFDGVPDPAADWDGFASSIERIMRKEQQQWNPNKRKVIPWIDLKKLHQMYSDSSCSIM